MQRQRFLGLALAAAGLMADNSPATAQTADQPPRAAADSGRRMFDPVGRLLAQRNELKITDEQATRLEALRKSYLEKNRTSMEKLREERAARAAFHARMDSTRAEVMAVLTPEQRKQVDEMRKQWRSGWRNGKHGDRHREGHRDGHGHDDHDNDSDDN